MGTTNELLEILPDYQVIKRTCYVCSRPIMDKDNLIVLYRTNHTTDWANFKEGEGRGWISLEIQLEHEECPE